MQALKMRLYTLTHLLSGIRQHCRWVANDGRKREPNRMGLVVMWSASLAIIDVRQQMLFPTGNVYSTSFPTTFISSWHTLHFCLQHNKMKIARQKMSQNHLYWMGNKTMSLKKQIASNPWVLSSNNINHFSLQYQPHNIHKPEWYMISSHLQGNLSLV